MNADATRAELLGAVHSPCIGVCRLDEGTGFCLGCGRTGLEVAEWAGADLERKRGIWRNLSARLDRLGAKIRLLPWSPAEIGAWAARQLAHEGGTWVIGVEDAAAEFPCDPLVMVDPAAPGTCVIAHRPDGAFRLQLHEKLRAFSVDTGIGRSVVALTLPKSRLSLPVATMLTPVGKDSQAIHAAHREMPLFDIGLGRKNCRICIRSNDPKLATKLTATAGQDWTALDGPADLIVETALARVELYRRRISPGGCIQASLPGAPLPGGLALPDWAALAAIHISAG